MVWVRLDDHFDQNPKIASVGPLGIALWTVGLAYCNRNLTDGFIPWNSARSLLSWEYLEPPNDDGRRKVQSLSVSCGMVGDDVDTPRVIDLLVYAGLWDIDDDRGGYVVHDYDHFQPLKEQVIEERRNSADRTARSRANSRQRNGASNSVTNGASNGVSTPAPVPVPVPVPSTTSDEVVESAGALKRTPNRKPPFEELTDVERGELLTKWLPRLPDANDRIELALEHEQHWKYPTGQKRYVDNWLRGDWERKTENGHQLRTNPQSNHRLAGTSTGPERVPDMVISD